MVIDEPSRVLAFSKLRMAKVTDRDSRIAGIIYGGTYVDEDFNRVWADDALSGPIRQVQLG